VVGGVTRLGGADVTVELAVVGAGIVGAAVTTEARRRAPAARVLLLDRSRAGSGASRHSAGLSTPTGATAAHRALAERSERWYAELIGAGEIPAGRPVPVYSVVDEAAVPGFQAEFTQRPAVPATAADLGHLRHAYPDIVLRPGEVVLRSTGWIGDAEATARALAAGLRRQDGGGCWEGVRIDRVEPDDDGGVLLLGSAGQRIRARRAVLATGPWLATPPAGSPAAAPAAPGGTPGWELRVKKVAALHLARRPAGGDPVVAFEAEDLFLMPQPERNQTLVSFYCRNWDVRPDAGELVLDRPELSAAVAALAARLPSLAGAVAGSRASCDGYLPGRLPAVVPDPDRPGVLLAGGCSGSGFRLGPGLAALAVDQLGWA
jgi:glycine/D-amino acid oxidase-like deaminating enzyme